MVNVSTLSILIILLLVAQGSAFLGGAPRRITPSIQQVKVQSRKATATTTRSFTSITSITTLTTPTMTISASASVTSEEQIASTNTNRVLEESMDSMVARAGLLRRTIVQQQLELQTLERQIKQGRLDKHNGNWLGSNLGQTTNSANVLFRKLLRVKNKTGRNNRKWEGKVEDFVSHQFSTGVRIVGTLLQNPDQWKHFIDPETPTLVTHVPAILSRLDQLEDHVAPILERVLNNRRHLASIEPYLDEILERFDDIEPHLPWILDNIDTLAPYCGLLLRHLDELLLYADLDEYEQDYDHKYGLAEQLLPFLEYYVRSLDVIGPHLPMLRPHIPNLLKHDRIGKISPHIDKLFQKGYKDLSASANMDILLFYFGWTLRVPGLPRLFFALPGSPRIVSFLANRLPKRFVRGWTYCRGISCYIGDDYGGNWNKLQKGSE